MTSSVMTSSVMTSSRIASSAMTRDVMTASKMDGGLASSGVMNGGVMNGGVMNGGVITNGAGGLRIVGTATAVGDGIAPGRERASSTPRRARALRASRQWSWLAIAAAMAAGCSDGGCVSRIEPPPSYAPFANEEPVSNCCDPKPQTITLRNDTDAAIGFDVTWGGAAFLTVAEIHGRNGQLGLAQPGPRCECSCEADTCADCSEPSDAEILLAPAEQHEIAWDGRLLRSRHNAHGEACTDDFNPPRSDYLFAACDRDGTSCARLVAEVPADQGLLLAFVREGGVEPPPTCATAGALITRAANLALYHMRFGGIAVDRLGFCDPESAACVTAGGPPPALAPGVPCAVHVLLGEDEIETRVLMRAAPPASKTGARRADDRFRIFLDAAASRVTRADLAE